MIRSPEWRNERTIALFLFGAVAVSPPFLAIFALDSFVFGLPLLYAYLFAVWAVLIALLAVLSGTVKDEGAGGEAVPPIGGQQTESPPREG
ncbi:MAG: hypothetical protein FJX37_05155 [Alphaproteobacteria bacterium]|nr:hypothetical protein [Alphaproteobacteria bacterium]MBM3951603.1 hypothetical protein [Rhodospirillales bacterium]